MIGVLTYVCGRDIVFTVKGDIKYVKILDEKVLKTDDEIEPQYKDCKYLTIIDSYDRIGDKELVLCQHVR